MKPTNTEKFNRLFKRIFIRRKIAKRALNVIETLTYPDIAMSAEEKLEEIYKFAHVGLGRCYNDHKDWIEDLIKTEKSFEKHGLSKAV